MPRNSKKLDDTIIWFAIIITAFTIIIQLLLVLLPIILLVGAIYYYVKWQNKKLLEYNNSWSLFYQHELKGKLKITAFAMPVFLGLGYVGNVNYQQHQKERLEQGQAEVEQKRIEKEQIKVALQAKKDSSKHYLNLASKDFDRKRYKKSLVYLDSALLTYPNNYIAQFKKGIALKETKNYQDALNELDDLSNKTNQYKEEIPLLKGKCLLKLNKKEEAIAQLHEATKLGNKVAAKLYDKINPIIKEITGYRQRCCDGTTSYSSGRGTCSHHGGVCKWNEPIFSERRKYRIASR